MCSKERHSPYSRWPQPCSQLFQRQSHSCSSNCFLARRVGIVATAFGSILTSSASGSCNDEAMPDCRTFQTQHQLGNRNCPTRDIAGQKQGPCFADDSIHNLAWDLSQMLCHELFQIRLASFHSNRLKCYSVLFHDATELSACWARFASALREDKSPNLPSFPVSSITLNFASWRYAQISPKMTWPFIWRL